MLTSIEYLHCQNDEISVSTLWTKQNKRVYGDTEIDNTFLIQCTKKDTKGTGFLISSGHIITNAHVVREEKLWAIRAISSENHTYLFDSIHIDTIRD
jgi:S1-C subfamily serine protease